MYDFGYPDGQMDETIPPDIFERRDGKERRKAAACGFTYVSTVGWICRRERFRREDDRAGFAHREP